jgi:two-component system NarL family sensor kinase
MNQRAREAFGGPESVLDVLTAGRRPFPLECFPFGEMWLGLGLIPDLREINRLERLRRMNQLLWSVFCRRGTRNLDLSRAEGKLDIHQRRRARERLLRRTGLEFAEAMEAERGRIARELHDNSGQALVSIGTNLELAEKQLGSASTEVQARIKLSRELASQTLAQIRRISHELNPPEWADQDFAQAVEWLIQSTGLRGQLTVDPVVVDVPPDLPPAVLTVLYRTLQEGFTNIQRHAGAQRISLEASHTARGVTLMLEDDGRGFDPAAAAPGIGLANIRRRIQSLGGKLEIRSSAGAGTCIFAFVPVQQG